MNKKHTKTEVKLYLETDEAIDMLVSDNVAASALPFLDWTVSYFNRLDRRKG